MGSIGIFGRGNFKCYPGVFRQVMLRRIFAAVGVKRDCCGAFFKGLTQQINAANRERYRANDSSAASPLSL